MTALDYDTIKYEDWIPDSYDGIDIDAKIHKSVRIEPFCVIEKDVEIEQGTVIGPYNHIRNGTIIGKNCRVGGHNVFEGEGSVIGDNVRLGTFNNLGWECVIEDDVFVGGYLTGANDKYFNGKIEGWTIKKGAKIGIRTTLGAGVTIAERAIVGLGSVVMKDVGVGETVYGNPAKTANRGREVEEISRLIGAAEDAFREAMWKLYQVK